MKLSKKEEELMQFIWVKKEAFMRDLLESFEEPKPASTTLVTLLKRLAKKGFIDYKLYGNSR